MHHYIFRYERIRKIREEKNLTAREVAKRMDYNFSALSRVENGKRNPSCDFVGKLAGSLGVTPNYFFEKVIVEENKDES